MNAKDRILMTLKGEATDRVPVYTLIPFAIEGNRFVPGPFHGYTDFDGWRKKDPLYRKLVQRMEAECDNFFVWRPDCMNAQNLIIPPEYVQESEITERGGVAKRTFSVSAGGKTLTKTEEYKTGTGHTWITEHFCKSTDDALSLRDLDYGEPDCRQLELKKIKADLGGKGVVGVTIPSPIQTVCRLFDPQDFLLFSALEAEKIDALMRVAFSRTKDNLVKLLDSGECDIVRFGGAEYATPPLMSPSDFDRLVYEYDKPLMDLCKAQGAKVAVHCHGNIRHALERFRGMGVDQTDPVESAPFGEVTLKQAREITGGQITLTGNIQFSELVDEDGGYIRERVKSIIEEAGRERLIISTTATPLERITPELYDNYNAMIDAVFEYGG